MRVPHKSNIVQKVNEGDYEVLEVFDLMDEKRDVMESLLLPQPVQQAFARAALTYHFGEDHQTDSEIFTFRSIPALKANEILPVGLA